MPLIGLRLIASRLNLSDLALLNATFDSRVQRQISSSNLVSELLISSETRGPLLYLVRCLRNVNTVKFIAQQLGSHDLHSLISSLNPTQLYLNGEMSQLINNDTNWTAIVPRLAVLSLPKGHFDSAYMSAELKGCSFPPTLTKLDLKVLSTVPYGGVLPSTLRALTVHLIAQIAPNTSFLSVAFATLPSLEQLVIYDWTDFGSDDVHAVPPLPKSLTFLELYSSPVHPDSLFWSSLDIRNSHLVDFVFDVTFFHGNFEHDLRFPLADFMPKTLLSLTLTIDNSSPEFTSLPDSITSLKLRLDTTSSYLSQLFKSVISKQTSIATLIIATPGAKVAIASPKEMDTTDTRFMKISADELPRSLTHLELSPNTGTLSSSISLSALDLLPPALQYLSLPVFILEHVPTLLKRAPRCALNITRPIPLWSEAFGPIHFPSCWTPTLDLQLLIASIRERYTRLNTYFTVQLVPTNWGLESPKGTTTILVNETETSPTMRPFYTTAASLIASSSSSSSSTYPAVSSSSSFATPSSSSSSAIPSTVKFSGPYFARTLPEFAGRYFPNLRKLIITIPFQAAEVPSSITHLEVTSPSSRFTFYPQWESIRVLIVAGYMNVLNSRSSAKLAPIVVDTPNTTFKGSDVAQWDLKNTEKLVAKINEIEDSTLLRFLAAVPSKLRPNMSIDVSYIPTGSLLPSIGPNVLTNCNWDAVCRETEMLMPKELNNLVPETRTFSSFGALSSTSSSSTSSSLSSSSSSEILLSSVISKLTLQRTHTDCIGVRLPRSATSINLNTGGPVTFLADSRSTPSNPHAPKFSPNLNTSAPTYHNAFGSLLVSMDVMDAKRVVDWWPFLPATLRHLRVHTTSSLAQLLADGTHDAKMEAAPFPPLRSLVLESDAQNDPIVEASFADRLLFKLDQLPSTLEMLVIKSMPLRLHTVDEKSSNKLEHLTHLKTVHISDIVLNTLSNVYGRLSGGALEEFSVVNCYEMLENSRQGGYTFKPADPPSNTFYPNLVVRDTVSASKYVAELLSKELESLKLSSTSSPAATSNPFSSFSSTLSSTKAGFEVRSSTAPTGIKKKAVRPIRR